MRVIKFRGKRVDNGEWEYGNLQIEYISSKFENYHISSQEVTSNKAIYPIVKETLGQYTGLKDKNGNELYEGDIFLFYHHKRNNLSQENEIVKTIRYKSYVVWDNGGLWTKRINNNKLFFLKNEPELYEVIGNVHDNPELSGDYFKTIQNEWEGWQ